MYQLDKIPDTIDKLNSLNGLKFFIKKDNHIFGPNDKVTPPHIHAELEIILNVSSDISFLVNGKLYPLNNGDVIISKPNDVHVCVYNKRKVQEMFILWLDEKDHPKLFNEFYSKDFSHKVTFSTDNKAQLITLFEKLTALFLKNDKDIEKSSLLLNILTVIKNGNKKEYLNKIIPDNFQKILNYINDNFATIYSVKDILEKNYISYSTLNRFFNDYLNVSPKEYLDSIKLSNAVKLLKKDFSVSDACFNSGFTDCSRFISIFKKRFGVTPFNYKKRA